MMDLTEKIISILTQESGLKAREITEIIKQEYNIKVEKKEVNRILYYQLKGKVYQDSNYRWSLGTLPLERNWG